MKVKNTKFNLATDTADLMPAPWNPRGEITPESVADLTASIKARGLLQDIGIWKAEVGVFYVIYGNRRFVACKEAGLVEIPCKLYDCTEAEARELTRIENELRLGISPIKDAELVQSMLDLGFNETEIAAHFGTSVAMVCRRAKLNGLHPEIREIADKITADALERLAVRPIEFQERMLGSIRSRTEWGTVRWRDISGDVSRDERALDGALFLQDKYPGADERFQRCWQCQKRTGSSPDLFGEPAEGESLGNCLDCSCYKSCEKAWLKCELDRRIPPGTERVKAEYWWNISGDAFGEKRSKTRPCGYWYFNGSELKVAFGPSKAAEDARRKAEQERDEAERRERRIADEKYVALSEKVYGWAYSGTELSENEELSKGEDFVSADLEDMFGEACVHDCWVELIIGLVIEFGLCIGKNGHDNIPEDVEPDVKRRAKDAVLMNTGCVHDAVGLFVRYFGSSLRRRIAEANLVGEGIDREFVLHAAENFKSLGDLLTEEEREMLRK